MNIVLLDDVSAHNRQLEAAMREVLEKHCILAKIALATTSFDEVLAYAKSDPPLTAYFLDIQLNQEETGLDICRQLRRENVRDRVVFVSAYPHFALACLKLHAYDFLMKPVDPEALEACVVSLYRDVLGDDATMLDMPIGSRIIRMPVGQILYFESQGRNVCAHTTQGNYTYAASLTALEATLAESRFLRIHRKYLVNSAHIQEWDMADDAVYVGGRCLPVSRRMRKLIAERVG